MRFHSALAVAFALGLAACTVDVPPPDGPVPDDPQPPGPVEETYPVDETSFEGFDVVRHLPPDPTALAFVFHGTGGSAQVARRVEPVDLLNGLVADGMGFVATESTDRDDLVKWDKSSVDPDDNPDLARLFRLRDAMIDDGEIGEQTPIVAFGMSNGAAFTSVFGYATAEAGWPIRALSMHAGPVVAAVRNNGGLRVPTFFVVSANDTVVDNDNIHAAYEDMRDTGVEVAWHQVEETALTADRFTRIPGVDEEAAASHRIRFHQTPLISATSKRHLRSLPCCRRLFLQEALQGLVRLDADFDGGAVGERVVIEPLPPRLASTLDGAFVVSDQAGAGWAGHREADVDVERGSEEALPVGTARLGGQQERRGDRARWRRRARHRSPPRVAAHEGQARRDGDGDPGRKAQHEVLAALLPDRVVAARAAAAVLAAPGRPAEDDAASLRIG